MENVSFDVADDAFRPPGGYAKAAADPTAEYRLRDHFELQGEAEITPESFRKTLFEKLAPGAAEEDVYWYLDRRLKGDRLSTYLNADVHGEIVCRVEFDPTLPGLVKKHFAVVLVLDDEKRLKDVRLESWITGL